MLVFVTGGAASGKSAWAEDLACSLEPEEKLYIATMRAWDDECRFRIDKHRAARAGKGFRTVECCRELLRAPVEPDRTVLLDCLTNLAANELFEKEGAGGETVNAILSGIWRILEKSKHLIVVSCALFSDTGVYSEETLRYIQTLGELHRGIAWRADRVVEVVCGIPMDWKGEPA